MMVFSKLAPKSVERGRKEDRRKVQKLKKNEKGANGWVGVACKVRDVGKQRWRNDLNQLELFVCLIRKKIRIVQGA